MTFNFRAALVLALALCGLLLAVPAAQAAAGNDYGPWFPAPGAFGKEDPSSYRADIQPFSTTDVKELANFSCLYPKGSGGRTGAPIPAAEQQILGAVFGDAADVFYGRLKNAEGEQSKYTADVSGMQEFLRHQQFLIVNGGWVRYTQKEKWDGGKTDVRYWNQEIWGKKGAAYSSARAKYDGLLSRYRASVVDNPGGRETKRLRKALDEAAEKLTAAKKSLQGAHGPNPQLGRLIDTKATRPLDLAKKVPEGCGLNPLDAQDINFIDLVKQPGEFFTDLLLYIPSNAAQSAYNFLQPYAFVYTFWTPHTERGDTIFNVKTSCYADRTAKGSEASADRRAVANACTSGQPLGFNKANRSDRNLKRDMPWYISTAIFFQWLVSGFYFIILFAATVLYMVRGNKNTQLNVLQLVPKLIASAILTMFAPFIIGMLISFSNVFVTTMFDFDSTRSVGRINDILSQSDIYVNAAGDLVARLIQLTVGVFTVFFFAFFIVASLIRQLLLMGLVVLAPLACFCLIVPRWAPNFNKYVRMLMAVIFVPAVMAFILKLGMALNPIVATGGIVNDMTGLIGLMLVIVTLWAMAKALKLSAAVATGNQSFMKSLSGRTMGTVGQMATMAGVAGLVPGAAFAGYALTKGSQLSAAGEGIGSNLVPSGRGMGGMGAGGAGRGLLGSGAGGRSSGLGLPAAGGSGGGGGEYGGGAGGGGGRGGGMGMGGAGRGGMGAGMGAGAGMGGGTQRRKFGQRYGDFIEGKQAEKGEQRVSHRMAMSAKKQQSGALDAKELELGRKMTKSEKDQFFNGSYVRDANGNIEMDEHKLKRDQPKRNTDGYYATNGKVVSRRGNHFMVEARGADAPRPATPGGPVPPGAPAGAPAPGDARRPVPANRTAPSSRPGGSEPRALPQPQPREAQPQPARVVKAPAGVPSQSPPQGSSEAPRSSGGTCARCGGPASNGACANPACAPEPRRRERSNVSAVDDDAVDRYMFDNGGGR